MEFQLYGHNIHLPDTFIRALRDLGWRDASIAERSAYCQRVAIWLIERFAEDDRQILEHRDIYGGQVAQRVVVSDSRRDTIEYLETIIERRAPDAHRDTVEARVLGTLNAAYEFCLGPAMPDVGWNLTMNYGGPPQAPEEPATIKIAAPDEKPAPAPAERIIRIRPRKKS